MKIGAQLYTLHDSMKTLEAFDTVLKRVADIGYRYVQVSGSCDYEADWLSERLQRYGLRCILTHIPFEKMQKTPKKICDDHTLFGCPYIGLGGMPNLWQVDDVSNEQVLKDFYSAGRPVMQAFKDNGKLFMYHNHQYEFAKLPDGKTIFAHLVDETDASEMGFTLDTYWVQFGGYNPEKLIRSLKGRVPCVHFKDYKVVRFNNGGKAIRFAPVGEGNLDWDAIIRACAFAGTEYVLVEQDDCYDENPFSCLERSFHYLKAAGLETE